MVEIILLWTRVVLYFFTAISLLIAGVAILRPMAYRGKDNKLKSLMIFSIALIFLFLGLTGILRGVGLSSIGLIVFDYLITPGMIVTCITCWGFIMRTSKVNLPAKTEPSNIACIKFNL